MQIIYLFIISAGDLGTTAKEVEKALEVNFALASRWGCILLLDEADVFLAERTKEDFKRNGLVAGNYPAALSFPLRTMASPSTNSSQSFYGCLSTTPVSSS